MDQDIDPRELRDEMKRRLALRLLALIGIAVSLLGLFALLVSQGSNGVAAVGVGGLIFLAAAAVGGVLGFLFAVPRVLAQADSDLHDAGAAPPPSGAAGSGFAAQESGQGAVAGAGPVKKGPSLRARLLRSNTNLERISDWLTTMLVGVGLSQLGNIDDALVRFRQFIASEARVFPSSVPGGPASAGILTAVGPMLLIFGLVMGFLFLYLYTRLVLTGLFHDVERSLDADKDPGQQPVTDPQARQAVVTAAEDLNQNSENPTLRSFNVGSSPSVAESLSVMFGLLYRPEGYQQVIDLGGKLANTPARQKAEYWFYMAAAFGQKYLALQRSGAPKEELVSARDNALDCARRAVDIDPSYRSRLWNISNPDNLDNDLSGLRDDPTFRAIVGVSADPPPSRGGGRQEG